MPRSISLVSVVMTTLVSSMTARAAVVITGTFASVAVGVAVVTAQGTSFAVAVTSFPIKATLVGVRALI